MPLENPVCSENPTGIPSLSGEWTQRAEEELNETPEVFRRELAALRRKVENDTNLTVPNYDEFLVRFLRARKSDSTKAFHMVTIDDVFRTNVLALEQIVREPETQIAGVVVILDMAGLNLQHAKFFTPYYAKKMVELVQETFPLRFKGFHVVNEPFYFDAVVAVLKPFLKEKIRKRIILHGSDVSSLHAFFSADILPTEYGGTAGNFDNRPWYMEMLAEENYFKTARTYGYKVAVDVEGED